MGRDGRKPPADAILMPVSAQRQSLTDGGLAMAGSCPCGPLVALHEKSGPESAQSNRMGMIRE